MASKTLGIISEASRKFEWKIWDFFSLTQEHSNYFDSTEFHAFNSVWKCMIYPNGNTVDDAGYVSLFLCRVSDEVPVTIDYKLGIMKKGNIIVNEHESAWKSGGKIWGRRKFIKRTELEEKKADLAPSGKLTVVCTLTAKGGEQGFDMKLHQLPIDLTSLYKSKENADLSIKLNNETILAHKSILTSRCPVFAGMFKSDMIENKTGVVDIADDDYSAFNTFLLYLYSGKAEFKKCSVFDLYKIADKYAVPELCDMCIDFMISNLSVENVCETYDLSHQFNEKRLQSSTQIYFCENFPKIVFSNAWNSFLGQNCDLANNLLQGMAPKMKIAW